MANPPRSSRLGVARAGRADGAASAAATRLAAAGRERKRTGVWQRFRRHRLALLGSVLLLLLTIGAIGAPVIARHSPTRISISSIRKPPSATHLLGTDSSGRDVLSRLLHAGRVSLSVGLVAVSIYAITGIILGSLAGFYGG